MSEPVGYAEVEVRMPHLYGRLDIGAVGRLRRQGAPRIRRTEDSQTIILPVGADPQAKRVELGVGAWSIEVDMPDGQMLQQDFTVSEGESVSVVLEADGTPRETLSWARYSGAVAGEAENNRRTMIAAPARGADAPAPPLINVKGAVHRVFDGNLQRMRGALRPAIASGVSVAGDIQSFSSNELASEIWEAADRGEISAENQVVRFRVLEDHARKVDWQGLADPDSIENFGMAVLSDQEQPVTDIYTSHSFACPDAYGKLWAVIDGFGERALLAIPSPWISPATGERPTFQIVTQLLEGKHGFAQLVVNDPGTAAVLGYMSSDRLREAAFITEETGAEELLFGKLRNRFAAAAAGYVMLATRLSAEDEKWHNWIINLSNWFDDLPDGAILEGTLRLSGPKRMRDFERAAECFDTACRRGIPYYTLGIAQLRRGLSLLCDLHQTLQKWVPLVNRVARMAEPNAPFTSLRFRRE